MQPRRLEPGPGQESVWDYPRPPQLELSQKLVEVVMNGEVVASTHRAYRVLETSHPPVYYIPSEDVRSEFLERGAGKRSFCEWKGEAGYFDLVVGARRSKAVAWFYPNPTPTFRPIQNYLAFYPSRVDECRVDGEIVRSQPGDFYGGWITNEIVGPFKGDPGTSGW